MDYLPDANSVTGESFQPTGKVCACAVIAEALNVPMSPTQELYNKIQELLDFPVESIYHLNDKAKDAPRGTEVEDLEPMYTFREIGVILGTIWGRG